jgi:hypothetical protein
MVDPKRVLALLSQQQAAKKKPACVDAKAVLFKIRKAAQLRQAAVGAQIIAAPPFEPRQV